MTRVPSKEEILDFIRLSPGPVGKREIARAFSLKGSDKIVLRDILKELKADGALAPQGKRRMNAPDRLPPVTVIEVTGLDEDGELLARPLNWTEEAAPPVIYVVPERKSPHALATGDRLLARLKALPEGTYEARTIKRLVGAPPRVLGVYEDRDGGRLRSVDRREKREFRVNRHDTGGAAPGELVLAEVLGRGGGRKGGTLGLKDVRVLERLGSVDSPRALSLVAIHEHGLPTEFPEEALKQARAAGPAKVGNRTDLRELPLVTIDGADARDFDDAVWAEPLGEEENPRGWRVIVAIADVAHYVRTGDELDQAARDRGNSAYFPDRVVPMLPHELSNGWCSLNPDEDRPCLVAHLWLDEKGTLRRHRFERGLMRSAARLTYEQVQEAFDGTPDETTEPLLTPVIRPLYGAFQALTAARERRGTLDLDVLELKVNLAEDGEVEGIVPRTRLDSHRLIEEFMINANVAAARELERLKQPCMYRVHDNPDPTKIEALAEILDTMGLKIPRGQPIRARTLNRILQKVKGRPDEKLVNQLVLRAQSQAAYSPENIGHFGLALRRYAHFTSPIRRYSDLMVHRALIAGLDLGEGGLPPDGAHAFEEIARHITMTERRATAAERDAVDRFTALYLRERVGAVFQASIQGVTRFGLFVSLDGTGADALVPISLLPDDRYDHIEARHSLVGRQSGDSYRLGDRLEVRLVEADALTGGLICEITSPPVPRKAASRNGSRGKLPGKPARRGKSRNR